MHPLQKSWWNTGKEKAGRYPDDLSGASQGSSGSSKAASMPKPFLRDEWVSYSAEPHVNIGLLMAWVALWGVKGCPFPTGPAIQGWDCVRQVEKTVEERVPWESKSQICMPCTLVCSLTSPLPSQRLSLALCGQKLKLPEKILIVTLRTVAVCTWIPQVYPMYLMLLGGQGCGFAVPVCYCFPGSHNEAEGEEKVCSTWCDSWLEERGIAPNVSRCCS